MIGADKKGFNSRLNQALYRIENSASPLQRIHETGATLEKPEKLIFWTS